MSDRIANRSIRCDESGRETGITRRGFLAAGGAAALSFFLPCLGSVGDGRAYAVETGSADADGQPSYVVYVISREEMGLSVVDVTDNAKTPVAGASVTLTSLETNASVTATTDENGLAVFNLKTSNLGSPIQLDGIGDGYRFEGSIKTVVAGKGDTWMDFEAGRLRVDGGRAVQTPIRRKASVSDPYFTMLSFDGWDILYTDNGVVSSPRNDIDHTFAGKLYVPVGTSATISLIARKSGKDDIVVFSKNVVVEGGFAQFSQTARYLLLSAANKDLLADGRDYFYRVTANGASYIVATKFTVRQAPVPEPISRGVIVAPDTRSIGSYSLPSDIPFPLGGSELSIWVPTFPVMGWASPQGYAFFASTISTTLKNTAPCTRDSAWRQETRDTAQEQCKFMEDVWSRSIDKFENTSNMLDPHASVKDKFAISPAISLDLTMQSYMLEEWDFDTLLWRVTFNSIFVANLGFSFTTAVVIGPVPLFITFKLGLGMKLSASSGMETTNFSSNLSIPKNAGIAFTATISVALSVGVGISGVASVSLRGSGFITTYVSFLDTSGAVPHVIVGYGLSADVVIQMLLFTWTGNLWSYKDSSLYDNALTGVLQDVRPDLALNPTDFALGFDASGAPIYSHDAPFDPTKGLDLAEFIRQSSIVTEKDLGKTREVIGTRLEGPEPLLASDEPPVALLGNGVAVIDLSGTGGAAGGSSAADAAPMAEFSYEFVGEDLDEACEATGGVAGLAASGGVIPSIDKKIATRTFSNPNCKVVVLLDTPYLCRLISVEYDDGGEKKTRTRLAVQKMGNSGKWGTPTVLEFPRFSTADVRRIDTFDYDFDVYANATPSTGYVDNGLCVVLLSGTRPEGDDTDFFGVSNSTIMTIATFDGDLHCITGYTWKDVPGADAAPFQSLLLPRIAPAVTGGENPVLTGLALLYLRRTADSAEAVLDSRARVTVECGYLSAQQLYLGKGEEVDPGAYDLTVLGSSGGDANRASFSFAVQSDAGTSIFSAFLGKAASGAGMDLTVKRNIVNASGIENGRSWPGRSAILASDEGVLTAFSFDPAVEGGTLERTKVGPEDEKITAFALSPSGNAVFYLVNQEGDAGQAYDDEGNPTSTEKIARHSIYACVCVDDLFTKPFPLAVVNHAIDALENAYVGSAYSFIATCITSMSGKSADIYYINVPALATAVPVGVAAENSFVCAGASGEPFLMELRNDGNVILTGCTVELRDADLPEPRNIVSTRAGFRFDRGALTGSIWNPDLLASPYSESAEARDAATEEEKPTYAPETLAALGIGEDHVLVNPAASGSLLPGHSGQYRIRFDIPKNWASGYKNVYITCKDFTYDLVTYGPGDSVVNHPTSLGADNSHKVTVSASHSDGGQALGDALLSQEGQSSGGQAGADADSGKGSQMAQTGDGAPATIAGLVLAAAAAGAVAYSARRRAVEREEHEASEAEHDD